jgi:hypothetical protein
MRTLLVGLACLALTAAAGEARADFLIKPSVAALESFGPVNEDHGPYGWQDNMAGGLQLELGYGWSAHEVTLGISFFPDNHASGLIMGMYRHHFGTPGELHPFAAGGAGIGCVNHRDYQPEYDTCSGGWQLAAGMGFLLPVRPHLALEGELLGIVSLPTKVAVSPYVSVSAVFSF